MNKSLIVAISTGILGIGVLCIPSVIVNNLPKAHTVTPKNIEYYSTVVAVGEVRKGSSNTVLSDIPVVVDKVLVKEGDSIQINQPVLTVNKEETIEKMAQINSYADLTDLGAESGITSYDDALQMIPDEIKSTVEGVVDSIMVSDGAYVMSNTTILTVLGSDSLIIDANIPEKEISKVQVGQKVIITGNAFGDKEYHGVVNNLSKFAQKEYVGTSQQIFVSTNIKFTDADNNIRPGYSANVKILTSEKQNLSILPYETIQQDNDGNEFVYVFNSGVAVRKDVITGTELGEGVEIVDGISDGENILYSEDEIKDGKYVNIKN